MKKSLVTAAILALLACILAISASAAVAESEYTDTPPNMAADVLDESWGKCAIHIDKDGPNSELHVYKPGLHPEDGLDIYSRWDDTYLYVCYVSPDTDPNGGIEYWKGDGIMSVMLAGDDVRYEEYAKCYPYTYSWSASGDLKGVNTYGGATKCEPTLAFVDGQMIAKIRIPLADLGYSKREDKTDTTVAVRLVRISARKGENLLSGWLAWGKFYETELLPTEIDTLAVGSNYIKLVKSAAEDPTPATPADPTPATPAEPVFDFRADDRPADYAIAEVTSAIKAGLVPSGLQHDYTKPVTRGAVASMFVNLLEKASGKTIGEIMAEKGVSVNKNAFTDTADEAVLAANALGIINGTGGGKFSPDGTLKRAQIAAIINRVAKVMGVKTEGFTHEFTDISGNYSWANAELGWPVHAGIINGVGGGKFNPGGELRTQDAILITYRALNALTK